MLRVIGGVDRDITFRQLIDDDTDTSVYTVTDVAIGDAHHQRLVIVSAAVRSNHTVTGVTIGGITAALAASEGTTPPRTYLWCAMVPVGTTATVVVTCNGTAIGLDGAVWSASGIASATPYGTGSNRGPNATPATVSLDIPSNGIAAGISANSDGPFGTVWTVLTEDTDIHEVSSASAGHMAAGTVNVTATGFFATLACASWR